MCDGCIVAELGSEDGVNWGNSDILTFQFYQVTISGHDISLYNGVYYKAEDWGGNSHYTKLDRTAHLFYLTYIDSNDGFWELDDRE